MIEKDIENYFDKQVSAYGGLARKLQWVGRRGAPDKFVKFPGKPVILVELKKPAGLLRGEQAREVIRLMRAGVDVRVICDKEGVDSFVQEMIK